MKIDKRKHSGETKRIKYWQVKNIIGDTTLASQWKSQNHSIAEW